MIIIENKSVSNGMSELKWDPVLKAFVALHYFL